MPYTVSKVDVWTAEIEDRPGGLADKLAPLAEAGVDLEFAIARRQAPGKGIVFLSGIKGTKASRAAASAGLSKTTALAALRIEGPNKAGICYQMTCQLAEAGINMRGLSAAVIGRKCVMFLAFDSAADANKAARLLKGTPRRRCR